MQPVAPIPSHRLHWSPVAPSWIIAGGVIVLAAMPHKLSPHFRAFVRQPLGFLLAAAAIAWLFTKHVVLGAACAMLILSVVIHRAVEGFATPPILIKDVVKRSQTENRQPWFEESIMDEAPTMIQDRTEESTFLQDVVSPEERATTWYDEAALNQTPLGIQERGVPETDRNPDY